MLFLINYSNTTIIKLVVNLFDAVVLVINVHLHRLIIPLNCNNFHCLVCCSVLVHRVSSIASRASKHIVGVQTNQVEMVVAICLFDVKLLHNALVALLTMTSTSKLDLKIL